MADETHTLAELVDLDRLRSMCDNLSAASDIVLAVLDSDGQILVASGWRPICTEFHRRNETTLAACLQSDLTINRRPEERPGSAEHVAYKCANGLWDVAFPLVIAGEHLANIYTGQFFYDDDEIDVDVFRRRAGELGFDEAAYLEALARVPVLSHARVEQTIGFLGAFVGLLAESGLNALQQAQEHAALRESEERYRQLFEAESDAVFLIDNETGRILEANSAASALYGYSEEELLALTNQDLSAEPELTRAVTHGTPVVAHRVITIPCRIHRKKDGTAFPVEITGRFFIHRERPVHVAAIRDITERTLAEEALEQSRQQYETFIDATDDMAFLKDEEMRYVMVNAANAAYFGRAIADIVGRTDAELMSAEGAESCRRSDLEALQRGCVAISHEDVGERIYETRKFPVRLSDDRVGVGGYVRDVTDQTLAERALEKRIIALTRPLEDTGEIAFDDLFDVSDIQRLQDDFADATGVASVITHVDGTPITTPSNFCRLCRDVIRGTDKGRANCFRSDAALGRLRADGPIIQTCLSGGLWDAGAGIDVGSRRIANWLIGQVRDETQTEEKMAEYARELGVDEQEFLEAFREVPAMSHTHFARVADALYSLASQLSTTAYQNVQQARFISEHKAAEGEIRRLNTDLERRVLERTAELEAANSELESFSYSISHDLRAPLRALDGFSQIVIEDYGERLDDEGRGHLQRIRSAAHHMAELMDGLLLLSRLNREGLRREMVDLSEMAAAVAEELAEQDEQRAVEIKIAPSLTASVDRQLARIVLENLLGNAWKFTSRHEAARIEVGAANQSGSDAFFVRDDGAGFDMRYADKLFGAFQRLHSPEQFEGTGIGLATVQRIVNRHGGAVWAEAAPEKGATFWFTFEPAGGD